MYKSFDAVLCTNVNFMLHNADLENYYSSIVDYIKISNRKYIPKVKVGTEKHWWTPEFDDLNQLYCIEITVWRYHGRLELTLFVNTSFLVFF